MKETKVRVRLDTRQAKGEMREVRKEGERTAGSISEGLSATIRRGFAMTGAGAAFAGGVGAARAAVSGGVGDARFVCEHGAPLPPSSAGPPRWNRPAGSQLRFHTFPDRIP